MPKKHPYKELWEGPRSGIDGTLELTGIDNAENTESLAIYLNSYLKENKTSVIWYNYKKPTHLEFHMKCMTNFLKGNSNGFIDNPTSIIQSMRLIKSPAEIEIMAESNRIASEAFTDVMRFSKPGINEAHLFAKMDFECRIRGAEYLAYPPVVAGMVFISVEFEYPYFIINWNRFVILISIFKDSISVSTYGVSPTVN